MGPAVVAAARGRAPPRLPRRWRMWRPWSGGLRRMGQ
uniref:Uncharacterized protein n=1 Tax=Arundo donax TaxID=35708 RepID=A0A0A9DGM6_ARUDO